jgi:hypothetical protein
MGLRNRMRDEWRVLEARADALLADWEAEASVRGLDPSGPAYWPAGEAWIRERAGRSARGIMDADARAGARWMEDER